MMLRRLLRWGLLALGCCLLLLGTAYGGMVGYLTWSERVAPSGQRVLVLKDGRQVPLVQPSSPPPAVARQGADAERADAVSAPPAPATLPPERITIPRIGVDWPVVLSDNDHLPLFRGVGWMLGSGWPGRPGNMVLFGHLDGPHATFMRLHELQPGDEFSVYTQAGEQRYRVRSSHETTPDDVAVLLPTSTATVTLITCSGPFDPIAQTNVRRLIVVADLI